jgi:hypothetical protein
MSTVIDRLREKPEYHRKRIALATSAGITLVLFAIWMATLPTRLAQFAPAQPAAISASSPIDSLRQNFGDSYQNLRNNISGTAPTMDVPTSDSRVSNGVVITQSASSTDAGLTQYPY